MKRQYGKYIEAKASRQKFSLEVITEQGDVTYITGIHMNSRDFLGVPKVANEWGNESVPTVYVNLPWIKEMLVEKHKLETRLDTVTNNLNKVAIKIHTYGRIAPEKYEAVIDALKDLYRTRTKTAVEMQEQK
jgi:hypothetical protein